MPAALEPEEMPSVTRTSCLHRFWTCWKPNRPLMQRLPEVMAWSWGDVTLTISLSWTWSVSVQPTPQYGQMVSVRVWRSSSQVPSALRSNSLLNTSAPVGHTAMQLPQYTQADSVSGTENSVEMWASKPRPATLMANVPCHCSPQASTHL